MILTHAVTLADKNGCGGQDTLASKEEPPAREGEIERLRLKRYGKHKAYRGDDFVFPAPEGSICSLVANSDQ